MGFEKFTMARKTFRTRVSIRKSGQIGFNNAAREKLKLDGFSHVILYYDKDARKIGIQLTTNGNENGAITLQKRKTNVAVSAKSFFAYYEINRAKTERYDPEWDEKDKMIIITLKNPETE